MPYSNRTSEVPSEFERDAADPVAVGRFMVIEENGL
jgi:hypothetical protein